MNAVHVLDRVNGHDVRMVQGGDGLGLPLEPAQALGRSHLGRQNLQRDLATEFRVLGNIDIAHAAGAKLLENLVVGQGLADHRGFHRGNSRSNFR